MNQEDYLPLLSCTKDETFLERACVSDEAMFHVCGTATHKCCVWGNKNPHIVTEYECEYCLVMCHARNGAHIEVYWTDKKLHEFYILKMYNFFQYIQ
jgi:hypothetical protein